jgi:hypothetical protein
LPGKGLPSGGTKAAKSVKAAKLLNAKGKKSVSKDDCDDDYDMEGCE